jgi:hypothetical protein
MAPDLKVINPRHIVRFWRSSENLWFQTLLTLLWNFSSWSSILLFHESKFVLNGKAITSLSEAIQFQPSVALIFALPVIGLWLTYHTLTLWFNRTELTWDDQFIVFRHGPLPWSNSSLWLDWRELEKIWIEAYSPGYQDGRPLDYFRLCVHSKSQGQRILLQKLSHADRVVLEKWLEESRLMSQSHEEAA